MVLGEDFSTSTCTTTRRISHSKSNMRGVSRRRRRGRSAPASGRSSSIGGEVTMSISNAVNSDGVRQARHEMKRHLRATTGSGVGASGGICHSKSMDQQNNNCSSSSNNTNMNNRRMLKNKSKIGTIKCSSESHAQHNKEVMKEKSKLRRPVAQRPTNLALPPTPQLAMLQEQQQLVAQENLNSTPSNVQQHLQVKLDRGSEEQPWGFTISGGVWPKNPSDSENGNPVYEEIPEEIRISKINRRCSAWRAGLRLDDIILSINGHDLSQSSHEDAVEAFRAAQEPIIVEVLRRPAVGPTIGSATTTASVAKSASINSKFDAIGAKNAADRSPNSKQARSSSTAQDSSMFLMNSGVQTEQALSRRQLPSPPLVHSSSAVRGFYPINVPPPPLSDSPSSNVPAASFPSTVSIGGRQLQQPGARLPFILSGSQDLVLTDLECGVNFQDIEEEEEEEFFDEDEELPEDLDQLLFQVDYEEVTLKRTDSKERLGLTLCYNPADRGPDTLADVFVGEVTPGSIAACDGRVREGDQVLRINGEAVKSRAQAVQLFRAAANSVTLLLARPPSTSGLQHAASANTAAMPWSLDDLHLEMLAELPSQCRQHRHQQLQQLQQQHQAAALVEIDSDSMLGIDTLDGSSHGREKDSGVSSTQSSEQETVDELAAALHQGVNLHKHHQNQIVWTNSTVPTQHLQQSKHPHKGSDSSSGGATPLATTHARVGSEDSGGSPANLSGSAGIAGTRPAVPRMGTRLQRAPQLTLKEEVNGERLLLLHLDLNNPLAQPVATEETPTAPSFDQTPSTITSSTVFPHSVTPPSSTPVISQTCSQSIAPMEWVLKRRADGSRYVARRPVRSRLLRERARRLAEERAGMTTDDDAASQLGHWLPRSQRKRHARQVTAVGGSTPAAAAACVALACSSGSGGSETHLQSIPAGPRGSPATSGSGSNLAFNHEYANDMVPVQISRTLSNSQQLRAAGVHAGVVISGTSSLPRGRSSSGLRRLAARDEQQFNSGMTFV